jgi:hypothetical protein
VWLAIVADPAPKMRNWAVYFAALALAALSTPTVIFILPASALSLFARFLTARDWSNLRTCATGFAGLGVFVLWLYLLAWRHGTSSDMIGYWVNGFSPPGGDYPKFLISQFAAMWKAAFQTHSVMRGEATLPAVALLAALIALLSKGQLARKPLGDIFLFYACFLATLCLLNFANIWPLGASRQNLFLFGHAIIFVFLVIGQLSISGMIARFALIAACLGLAWFASFGMGPNRFHRLADRLAFNEGPPIERSDLVVEDLSSGGVVGKTIEQNCSTQKTTIVLDHNMSSALTYYGKFDSRHRQAASLLYGHCVRLATIADEPLQDPEKTAAELAPVLATAPAAWFLFTHYDEADIAALRRVSGRFGHIAQSRTYRGAGYFRLVTTLPAAKAADPKPTDGP